MPELHEIIEAHHNPVLPCLLTSPTKEASQPFSQRANSEDAWADADVSPTNQRCSQKPILFTG